MPTLAEAKGLLTLILVSLVLTAWIGGPGGQSWRLTAKPHTTSRHPPPAPRHQLSLPPGSRAPPQGPVCHEKVR